MCVVEAMLEDAAVGGHVVNVGNDAQTVNQVVVNQRGVVLEHFVEKKVGWEGEADATSDMFVRTTDVMKCVVCFGGIDKNGESMCISDGRLPIGRRNTKCPAQRRKESRQRTLPQHL